MADDETAGTATILAMHAMVSWLVKREVEREGPTAGAALTRHVAEAMMGVTQLDPSLAQAAHAARGVVARAIGDRPMFVRLHG
ncbi:hypothetical protein [Methylobacterium flocculans]|uniref:hypothetical protein n=1 Tax=Methylobacterium flocculans TaxID=2984843 RepID=UPI0021F346AA|nr:hypothetical protein [Methylobacterium sp. FF17]